MQLQFTYDLPEPTGDRCNQPDCDKKVLAKGLCSKHYSRLRRHGDPQFLGRTPEEATAALIAHVKKHPTCYWKGKKRGPHSDETKAKMSAAHKGRPNSPEHTANILANWRKGKRFPHAGVEFRSSYEARFAKALDARGIPWEYEPRRFDLGTCSYTPDFYLPETGVFWETKGYLGEESRFKVGLFREQYPELPLVVATLEVIKMMERMV